MFRFPLEDKKYLLLYSPRSGTEAKLSVDFRYSTRNTSNIRRKVGAVYLNTNLPLVGIRREAEKKRTLTLTYVQAHA